MKVQQDKPETRFYPVTITLESQFEINVMRNLVGSINGGGSVRSFTNELFDKLFTISDDCRHFTNNLLINKEFE